MGEWSDVYNRVALNLPPRMRSIMASHVMNPQQDQPRMRASQPWERTDVWPDEPSDPNPASSSQDRMYAPNWKQQMQDAISSTADSVANNPIVRLLSQGAEDLGKFTGLDPRVAKTFKIGSAPDPSMGEGLTDDAIEALANRGIPDRAGRILMKGAGDETKQAFANASLHGEEGQFALGQKVKDIRANLGDTDQVELDRFMSPGSSPSPAPVARQRGPELIIPGRGRIRPNTTQLPVQPPITSGGLSSTNPFLANDVTKVPKIDELLGAYRDVGRSSAGQELGAAPKTYLVTPEGGRYMYKGAVGQGGNDTMASIGAKSLADPYSRMAMANEEAASRLGNTFNKVTPVARRAKEGGTLQRMIPDTEQISRFSDAQLDSPEYAHQMMRHQIDDTVLQNADHHGGNFIVHPGSRTIIPVDKGLSDLMEYEGGNLGRYTQGQDDVANYYSTYGKLNKANSSGYGRSTQTGVWNKYLDPQVGMKHIHETLQQVPESSFREALYPLKDARGMSDADFDTIVRSMMHETSTLGPRFDAWYRRQMP